VDSDASPSYARPMRRRLPVLGLVLATVAVSAALWAGAGGATSMRSFGACSVTQKKSLTGTAKTAIKFANKTTGSVQLYWLDYKGHLVYYTTLAPRKAVTQPTFKTHPWLMFDASFRCIGYVIAPKPSYTIS
jgi:hypothetical protein